MEKKDIPRFCLHVLKGRWLVAVVSFYILSCAGATYIFSIYSGAIKSALQYDQTTIGTLGFFKDLGANVGIVSGLLNEITPSWAILGVGACMNLFGYLMMWLAVTRRIARPPVWQMYLYMCVGANSQTYANTGVTVVCVKNFPQSRGVVLGLLKGSIGLSGAIFTQFYYALYGKHSEDVILLVGWLPCLVSLLFMFVVRPMKPEMDKHENKTFFSFLYMALMLAGFLMVVIIIEKQANFSSSAYKVTGLLTLLLIVANIWVGVRAEMERFKKISEQPSSIPLERKVEKTQHDSCNKEEKQLEQKGFKGSDHDSQAATPATNDKSATTLPTHDKSADHSASSIQSPDHSKQANQDGHTNEGHMASKNGQLHETKQPHQEGHADEGYMADKAVQHHEKKLYSKESNTAEQNGGTILTAPAQTELVRTDKSVRSFFSHRPQRGDDFSIPQALLSLDMWILFLATTCGVGATLTAMDNMGQIGQSLGYSPLSISTCVSLISIWNFLGRVIAGFSSEFLLQRYRFPRTLMLSIVLGLACAGHLMIALPAPGSLYIASVVVGLCFGAQWPLLAAVISELFGLKHYATLFNVGGVASPLGSYLLNVRVAGYLYDQEARKQGLSDLTCVGSQCFRMTFLIMTAVSFFGSLVSLFLVARTRKFYSQDIYAKFKKEVEKEGDVCLGANSLQQV